MTRAKRVSDVLERYGNCVELVPMDAHFHDVSVGLYVKEGTCAVWSFSQKEGITERIRQIRDQMVALGGLEGVEGTGNQITFPCGHFHARSAKFLLTEVVGKGPDYVSPRGDLSIKDTKSPLTLMVAGREDDDRWIYQVSGEGEAPNVAMRLRMVVAGFVRYGEMERLSDTEVAFPCGQRHDELVWLTLPYSRNISSVESMMDAEALRGQMTTSTLGFSPL